MQVYAGSWWMIPDVNKGFIVRFDATVLVLSLFLSEVGMRFCASQTYGNSNSHEARRHPGYRTINCQSKLLKTNYSTGRMKVNLRRFEDLKICKRHSLK